MTVGRGDVGLLHAVAAAVCAFAIACGQGEASTGGQGGSTSLGGSGPSPGGNLGYGGGVGCFGGASAANVVVAEIAASGSCLPRSLPVSDGRVECAVVEAYPTACTCAAESGERTVSAAVDAAVRAYLRASGVDGACDKLCVCALEQLMGASLTTCQNDAVASSPPGFCYIDPAQGAGSPALVAECSGSAQRKLRYVGGRAPGNANTWLIACGSGI